MYSNLILHHTNINIKDKIYCISQHLLQQFLFATEDVFRFSCVVVIAMGKEVKKLPSHMFAFIKVQSPFQKERILSTFQSLLRLTIKHPTQQ